MEYDIGQTFSFPYPPEAAVWCNGNNAYIEEIEPRDGLSRFRIVAVPEPTFEELKASKLQEINAACDAILNAAVSTYPESEVLTFDQQVEEARAYQASGKASDAPLLSALAQVRGIALDDLAHRVMAKRAAFSRLSGYVIGQRQALEDRLDGCQTVAEVEALVVELQDPSKQEDKP